jgi:Activator of Hsp90 ATPase homolog 1-like protein
VAQPDNVVPLRHPPIRKDIVIRSDVAHTFAVFTSKIGHWWPTNPYSLGGQERVVDVKVEPALGGRVYEVWTDGQEVDWGKVIAWDPPGRFAMTWHTLPTVTEVELRFRPLGPAVTRVELEHRGWDRLTEEQLVEAANRYGGYETGWQTILAAFRHAAEAG